MEVVWEELFDISKGEKRINEICGHLIKDL